MQLGSLQRILHIVPAMCAATCLAVVSCSSSGHSGKISPDTGITGTVVHLFYPGVPNPDPNAPRHTTTYLSKTVVHITNEQGEEVTTATTDSAGVYLVNVPPGAYKVTADKTADNYSEHLPDEQTVVVTEGTIVEANLTFRTYAP